MGRQKLLKLTKIIGDLRGKQIENKTLYQSLGRRKIVHAKYKTISKKAAYVRMKMHFIKKRYLDKPSKRTLNHIPQYFTNKSIQVMMKLKPQVVTYNISVIPNWIYYIRVKIHDYGQQYNTVVNEYITTRALWKKYRKLADKS